MTSDLSMSGMPHPTYGAVAWSTGARAFEFNADLAAVPPIGALVTLTTSEGSYVGQVVETQPAEIQSGAGARIVNGRGTLVAQRADGQLKAIDSDATFESAQLRMSDAEVVQAFQRALSGGRTTLPIGPLRRSAGGDAQLIAAGFNRHTFLCGQSGSGKTYSLGVLLEQLLLRTTLPIVVLDPNSDYVHLDNIAGQPGVQGQPVGDVVVFRDTGPNILRVRYGRLPLRQQALCLQLDPLRDADEYDLLRRISESAGTTEYSVKDVRDRAEEVAGNDAETARRFRLRIDNLGVADWGIWAERDQAPLLDQLGPNWRAGVVDLGAVPTPEERSACVSQILSGLWARRTQRNPILVVIDEAHNVCPQEPGDVQQALAIEHAQRIAAEGRKYGIYLLLATQSPRKLHVNVVTQCENLLLMRMNSAADVEHLADVFSHVPRSFIAQSTGFTLGEGLAAGRISPTPQLFKSGARLSAEGGADVPTTWADPV